MAEGDEAGRGFGPWLEAAMAARGLSQADLARRLGVDAAQVSRWRRGLVVPTVRHLQAIAAALDVPRATLDRLAGYPVDDDNGDLAAATGAGAPAALLPVDAAGALPDPGLTEELAAWEAWFGRLLRQRLPPSLWRAYASACAALAEDLAAAYERARRRAEGG